MKYFFFLILSVSTFYLNSTVPSDLLHQVDKLANFDENDFAAEYTIVQDIPGKQRNVTVANVFRRDNKETYTIVILKPEVNKGQGYLKQKNTLWFYDPESRKFNSTSSKNKFQNSNAKNSDFTRSTLNEDYNIVNDEDTKLGNYKCWKLTLEAKSDQVTYPKMEMWISKDDLLVRMTKDYSLSGQLLRTTLIPSYQKIGTKYFPKSLLYVDALKGSKVDGKFVNEKTQITISKASTKDLPDSVFSKIFLENINK